MSEFDKDVQCNNCGLCRADSRDYLGRCSRCGERDWSIIVDDGWLSEPDLEELAESTGQTVEQLKKDREAFLKDE